jgi:hypothetical protein
MDYKKSQSRALFLLFLIMGSMFTLYAFSFGDGSFGDPFQVTNCDDLQNISNYLTSNFTQTTNIDCGVSPYNVSPGFDPIGPVFLGSYDGQDYSISNLFINLSGTFKVGLFKDVRNPAGNFSNIDLINVSIYGSDRTAALIGVSYHSSGIISNVYVSGNVVGVSEVGGLVGNSYTEIYNSYSDATVFGTSQVGGLVGRSWENIFYSYATGDVTGTSNKIGGLIGEANSDVFGSYATGDVLGNTSRIGGLIGETYESINDSYATGDVYAPNGNEIGGIVGYGGDIYNSYSTGNVTGNTTVGGLAGYAWATSNSYWNNHSGNINNSLGSGDDSGVIGIVNDLTYFYVGTNEPMASWDQSSWDFSGSSFPTLVFNLITLVESSSLASIFPFGGFLISLLLIFSFLIFN